LKGEGLAGRIILRKGTALAVPYVAGK